MLTMYQVDAFTDQLFAGNPATVLLLDEWLDDDLMQKIALENNLSETSFATKVTRQNYEIRWFSPVKEVQFCGYGTLAMSFIIFRENPELENITFHVAELGQFYVRKAENGFIVMNFPQQKPTLLDDIPNLLQQALSHDFSEVYINPQAYIVVYPSTEVILKEQPDFEKIKQLGGRRVAITAKNDLFDQKFNNVDIVSRYFTPSMGIDEDPVTGSLHTSLIPLWQPHFDKASLTAYQASQRGGLLYCKLLENDRVEIAGQCQLYMKAELFLDDVMVESRDSFKQI